MSNETVMSKAEAKLAQAKAIASDLQAEMDRIQLKIRSALVEVHNWEFFVSHLETLSCEGDEPEQHDMVQASAASVTVRRSSVAGQCAIILKEEGGKTTAELIDRLLAKSFIREGKTPLNVLVPSALWRRKDLFERIGDSHRLIRTDFILTDN